jgi:hypothetical protein
MKNIVTFFLLTTATMLGNRTAEAQIAPTCNLSLDKMEKKLGNFPSDNFFIKFNGISADVSYYNLADFKMPDNDDTGDFLLITTNGDTLAFKRNLEENTKPMATGVHSKFQEGS